MTVEQQNPKTKATGKEASRSLHKSDLVVPLFIFSGFGATYVTFMSIVASIYDSHGHSTSRLVTVYGPALIYLPCFLIALLRPRWTSIPLWLCSVSLLVVGYIQSQHPADAGPFRPSLGMLLIPALAQLARLFRNSLPSART